MLGHYYRVPLPTVGVGVMPGARGYPRIGGGGSTVWPSIVHLTAGLYQPGPPRCRGNEGPWGHSDLAHCGAGLAWGPSLAPALRRQCTRGWGPIRLGCWCQEVGLLGWRMGAGAFITPILFCSFPSCPRDGELGRGIVEMVEERQPPAAWPSAASLHAPSA